MRRAAIVVLLLLAAPWAAAGDVVLRRVEVPEPSRPHGEVRIVLRDGTTVVQTLLHSRSLRRVAGAIAEKEAVGWPPDAPGAADSARYVDALAEIAAAVRAAPAERDDRRRALAIELAPAGPVILEGAVVERDADGLRLVAPRPPRTELALDAAYVERNRRLIVADAFDVDEATAQAWLAPPSGL